MQPQWLLWESTARFRFGPIAEVVAAVDEYHAAASAVVFRIGAVSAVVNCSTAAHQPVATRAALDERTLAMLRPGTAAAACHDSDFRVHCGFSGYAASAAGRLTHAPEATPHTVGPRHMWPLLCRCMAGHGGLLFFRQE